LRIRKEFCQVITALDELGYGWKDLLARLWFLSEREPGILRVDEVVANSVSLVDEAERVAARLGATE